MQLDLDRIAKALVGKVRTALDAMDVRVRALEQRAPVAGPQGDPGADGVDGKDADPVDVDAVARSAAAMVAATIASLNLTCDMLRDEVATLKATVAALHVPRDGQDGKDADPEVIRAEVAAAVAALPAPKDGADGRDGKDGEAIPLDVVASLVKDTVAEAVAAIPIPKDGKDGVGLAGALLSREGELVLTLSNGELQTLGVVLGDKGEPGPEGAAGRDGTNGRDAVLKGNIAIKQIDERHVAFCWDDGTPIDVIREDGTVAKDMFFAVMIHRGVYESGKTYEQGDCVTWGGHTWHAKATTSLKPDYTPASAEVWGLIVKAGRDGRSGKDGSNGRDGRDGKDGQVVKW